LVLQGKVAIEPYVERHPLHEAPALLEAVARHEIRKRVILIPQV
jgi:hypothetical protein